MVQPLVDSAADELVVMFTDRLRQSLEVAVSSFASELDVLTPPSLRVPAAAGRPRKAKPTGGDPKQRTHKGNACRLCGQEGVTARTCGKRPDHPGTSGGARQLRAKPTKDDDDDEPAPLPAPRPAPSPVPPPAVASRPPPAPPQSRRPVGPVPSALKSLKAPSASDKLEAMKDKRLDRMKSLMAKKSGAATPKEGNAKWNELSDDEEDERPLTEREVLSDYRATTID